MTNKNMLLLTSALVAFAAYGGLAHAQSTTSNSAGQSATSNDNASVSEVIVTANKRNESVEDVPVAVTAFTPEQRDLEGVVSIFDITRATPSFEYSTAIDRAFIRGIGRNTNAPGTQVGVALYIDGVYTPSTYGLDRAPILSGNTEVDSGPQGTLFGRNSIGGVIQQNSAHATDQFEIQTDVRYNDHNRVDVAATIGGPVNDHLKLLYGIDYRDQTKGYFYNEALKVDAGGPTTERLNYLIGDYNWGKFEGFAKIEFTGYNRALSQYSQYGAVYSDETIFNDYTSNNGIGVIEHFNCAAIDPITHTAQVNCPGNVAQATPYYSPVNPLTTNPFLINVDTPTHFKSHNDWDAVDQTTWHAPWFDVKYIGGYTQYIYDNHQDYDGTARGVFSFDPDGPTGTGGVGGTNLPAVNLHPEVYQYYENRKWSSHELDFSNNTKGPLNWIFGLYYYEDNFLNSTAINSPGQTQLANALNPVTGVIAPNSNLNYYSTSGDAITQSQAAFGQVEYSFTPKWTLTAGLRYNYDKVNTTENDHYYEFVPGIANYNAATGQYVSADYSNYYVPGTCTPNPAVAPAIPNCHYDPVSNTRTIYDSWGGWGGTVNLSYKPDDSSLAYIKYSRGYKAGGIQISGAFSIQPILNPETLDAYEAGYKFSPNRTVTLNGDIFYYDYHNYQDFGSLPTGNTVTPTVSVGFNVPKSTNVGFELTGDWHPIHAFTVNFSGNVMDAKVENGGKVALVDPLDPLATGTVIVNHQNGTSTTYHYKPSPCGLGTIPSTINNNGVVTPIQATLQCINGDALKGASPWKIYVSPDYRLDFAKGSLDLIATYSLRAGNVSTYSKDPVYKSPAYDEIDLRAVWSAAGSKYKVFAFIDNITNKQGTEFVLAGINTGDGTKYVEDVLTVPRTYGIELQAKF